MNYFSLPAAKVLENLKSNQSGLLSQEAVARLEQFGPNKLIQTKKVSPIKILFDQFNNFLVYLLLAAAVLSFVVGEAMDAGVILLIIILNSAIGFFQEYKAEEALAKLKTLESAQAKVLRNGEEVLIEADDLVPGDIVILQEGDRIPADGRIIESADAQSDESMLTGESRPISKNNRVLKPDTVLAERFNMLYSGTLLIRGKANMVVTQTGMKTEFGKIADLVQQTSRSQTPLQITLAKLGKTLGLISIAVATPVLILGLHLGRDLVETLLMAVALAVSAIPEGLPVVVTIVLAFGVKKMVKKNVLIRKLSAVEALGSTDVICTDKTGTITQNKMQVNKIWGFGYGEVGVQDLKPLPGHKNLLLASLLCNDATQNIGDPTEKALVDLVLEFDLKLKDRERYPRLNEIPFNSQNKYMITLNQVGSTKMAFLKGAPEKILDFLNLSKKEKERVKAQIDSFTSKGMRVLALAYKKTKSLKKIQDYKFLGLLALIDPPRRSVPASLKACKQAGIRVIMITGDHPLTAETIGEEVGIKSEKVLTGPDIDELGPAGLSEAINKINIFARVSPQHKLDILRALQNKKHFVAMTGDGVNDAPALKEANIGIAVGSGSDLAKEVADMIILDDDFSSIVAAIKEGRGIFSNIKKVIAFLIALNFDEIFLMMTNIILHWPLPLLPIHILWLNLASDSFPALALSVDPYAKGLMKQKPYDPQTEITRGILNFSLVAGILGFVANFTVFVLDFFVLKNSLLHAQTMTFTTTVLFELFFVFVVRTNKKFKDSKPFSNKWLLMSIYAGIIFQLFAIYFVPAKPFFRTEALSLSDWSMLLPFALLGLVVFELLKVCNCVFWKRDKD